MKIALAAAFLLLAVLAGYHFRDRLAAEPGVHLSPVSADFNSIAASLKTYKINAGHYPSTEQGLAALITRPDTEPLPKKWIKLLKKLPPDPWEHPFEYVFPSAKDPHEFEIRSAGKDGVFGTKDDISSLDD